MDRTPIFYYHSVGSAPPQTMPLSLFRRNLEAIREHGFHTITVADLVANGARPKTVVLTFDDGLLDNYRKVFPMLLEFGMVATFYVVPGYDRVRRWVNPWTGGWSDESRRFYTLPFESIRSHHRQEMARHGMEIGCHTYTHKKLTEVPIDRLDYEIIHSKAFLEDELGKPVTTFCYPNGRFNRLVLAKVKEAGYEAACSTIPGYYGGTGHPHILNRFLVEGPDVFEATLLGRFFAPATLARLAWRKFLPA